MFHFALFTILILFSGYVSSHLINHRIVRQAASNSCRTSDNKWGQCVILNECPHLQELSGTRLLVQGQKTPVFLRRLYCGFEKTSPKFCCSVPISRNPAVTSSFPVNNSPAPTTPKPNNWGTSKKKDYSECGKSIRTLVRIIGGTNTMLGEWPWIVAVGFRTLANPKTQFRCGGSLISNRWVLTAGHCVVNIGSSTKTVVRVGDIYLNEHTMNGASPTDIPIEEVISHPQYRSSPLINDIALLRLKTPVTFSAQIRPICLPKKDEHKTDQFYHNKVSFIAGWGYTQPNTYSSRSNILLEAQVDIVDREACKAKYKLSPLNSSMIDHRVLCAGRRSVDSCQGDSGGPMIIPIEDSYYLIGIVSYGYSCANPFFPGLYTRVANYFDWIRSATGIEF